jgi:hypothetical protein
MRDRKSGDAAFCRYYAYLILAPEEPPLSRILAAAAPAAA